MADVTYVNSATGGATSGTAESCTAPASIASGDILVAMFNNNETGTISDNNGATPFTQGLARRGYNGNSGGYTIWYRVAGGSEPATYNFTCSASDRWAIIIAAFRGGHVTDIWDVAPSASTESLDSSNTRNSPTLTTITNGAMMIAMGVMDSSTLTFSATPADSFTSMQNNSGEELLQASYKVKTTAGLQAAVGWTTSVDGTEGAFQLFSIKPAPVGWTNISKVDGIASTSISKVDGVAVASISKVNGIAV